MSDLPNAMTLDATLAGLRSAWHRQRPDVAQRRADLQRLRDVFRARLGDMAQAIAADFGHRSHHESLLADGMAVLAEIDHLLRHLRRWTRPRRVSAGWRLWPARAEVRPVPVGVVGVIAPWNYPVNLALVPLATAIAAGNHVLLKPSEHAPRTSAFLRRLIGEVFPADRVAIVEGDAGVAAGLAALPLDHLVFTGSTAVGRKVMAAAAANLTPLTLELGGKSPAIICPDFPLALAAARLATGKWFNAGQTCIAPDYVLTPEPTVPALVEALRSQVRDRYGDFSGAVPDYTRIINDGQYRRLRAAIDEARVRGAEVIELATLEPGRAERERLIPPTLVLQPPPDIQLMQDEIFGPVLPIVGYRTLQEAIAFVNARPRPLALYPFSRDRRSIERILQTTVAGGVTVNDTLLHFAANGLPFGGIGASGMGAYHGRAGFDSMSKWLPVLWQAPRSATDLLRPPYVKIDRLLRWLVR
ncbi:MAG TPA: aldehyde dehydrogenase family protein [Stenotrophomonas sp.]|jgi:coniferyl-aldehyde dehydrogenase